MVVGFGGTAIMRSTGFVLNNYASTDHIAIIARIAIDGGILCGYRLTFTALRDGIMDLWNEGACEPETAGVLPRP